MYYNIVYRTLVVFALCVLDIEKVIVVGFLYVLYVWIKTRYIFLAVPLIELIILGAQTLIRTLSMCCNMIFIIFIALLRKFKSTHLPLDLIFF